MSVKNFLSFLLLAALLFTPFLTSALNEQSPFEFIKLYTLCIVTIFGFSVFLISTLKSRQIVFRWNLGLTLVGVIGLANALSYLFSNNQLISFWSDINVPTDSMLTYIIFFGFCFLCSQVLYKSARIFLIKCVLITAGFLLAAYGVVQHFGLDPVDWWGYSQMKVAAYGTIGQAVGFGSILGALICLAIVSYFQVKKKWQAGALLLMIMAFFLAVMYSGSRGPALGSAIVALACIAIATIKLRSRSTYIKSAILILIFVGAQCIYFFENEKSELTTKFKTNMIEYGLSERSYIWQDAIAIWKKYPILGAGPETFGIEQKIVNRKEHNRFEHWELIWTKAHNHYFHHLATTGLVGLSAELLLILFILLDLWRLIRKTLFDNEDLDGVALALGFLFICLNNLTAFNFVYTQLLSYLLPTVYFIIRSRSQPVLIELKAFKKINMTMVVLLLVLMTQLMLSIYNYWKADVLFGQAKRTFLANKDGAGALKAIDEAIILTPFNPRLFCRKATIVTALLTSSPNKYTQKEAADTVKLIDELTDTCINLEPQNSDNISIKAKLFAELFFNRLVETPEISEKSFLMAAEYNPNNPNYYYRLALLYLNSSRTELYLKNMHKAIELKDDFLPAYTDLLGFFYRKGDHAEVELIIKAISEVKIDKSEYISEFRNMINLTDLNKDESSKAILMKAYMKVKHLEPGQP